MEIRAFFITVIIGFLGASIFGNWLNWPDAGAVFSIAAVGSMILWAIKHQKDEDN